MTPIEPTDQERTNRLRELVKTLNGEVNAAKQSGLDINLDLAELGTPHWRGYIDSVKVSRKY